MKDDELLDWITKITTEFYELVYQDPWFSKIFRNIRQEIITSQQIEFMLGCFGGPKLFGGRVPKDAHPQIWVNEDIWQYREELLTQVFAKLTPPQEIVDKWLKIDESFKSVIVNQAGPEECVGRYRSDEIIYEPMPDYLKKKRSA